METKTIEVTATDILNRMSGQALAYRETFGGKVDHRREAEFEADSYALAAVAELVEAANAFASAPRLSLVLEDNLDDGPITRLRAALAKFGGAK